MDASAILKSDLDFDQKCSQTQTYIDLKNSMFCFKKKKKKGMEQILCRQQCTQTYHWGNHDGGEGEEGWGCRERKES